MSRLRYWFYKMQLSIWMIQGELWLKITTQVLFYTFDVLTNVNVGFKSRRPFIVFISLILLHVILNTFAMLLINIRKHFSSLIRRYWFTWPMGGRCSLLGGKYVSISLYLYQVFSWGRRKHNACLNDLHWKLQWTSNLLQVTANIPLVFLKGLISTSCIF